MKQTKLGTTIGTLALVYGVYYGTKNKKGFGGTALFAVIFGIGGVIVGNAISKFIKD